MSESTTNPPSLHFESVSSEAAREFLLIPEVWERTADPENPRDFEMPAGLGLMGATVDSELAGLTILHQWRDGLKLPFYVLRAHRRKVARAFIRAILGEIRPGWRVYAAIGLEFRAVVNFARHSGFVPIDIEDGQQVMAWDS